MSSCDSSNTCSGIELHLRLLEASVTDAHLYCQLYNEASFATCRCVYTSAKMATYLRFGLVLSPGPPLKPSGDFVYSQPPAKLLEFGLAFPLQGRDQTLWPPLQDEPYSWPRTFGKYRVGHKMRPSTDI